MKKIGIDARLIFQTGVGVYIRNLLHYLQEEEATNTNIQFYVYVMEKDADKLILTAPNFKKRVANYQWHTLSEQIGFLLDLYHDKLDLMHFTYFSHPIFYNRPFISTIHDVILLEHKTGKASTLSSLLYSFKHFIFTFVFFHQVNKSLAIITPTETVKKQIITFYGEKYTKKIIPIYEGIDYQKALTKESSRLAGTLQKPFFIYVGNFYPHKNVERLVEAFSRLKEDKELILIGPDDFFSQRINDLILKLRQHNRVHLLHNISDADLIYCYRHAEALVHPSLSEGFGLPLVEAQHFQLPVVASDIPVFKELLGSFYCSFDPKSIDSIQKALESFLKNGQKKVSPNSDQYSFKTMTKKIAELYEYILSAN